MKISIIIPLIKPAKAQLLLCLVTTGEKQAHFEPFDNPYRFAGWWILSIWLARISNFDFS